MFEPSPDPRVFGLPPGVDFPEQLIAGLRQRLTGQPPEAMARVQVIVNTRRMARRIRTLFDEGPAGFLPKISLLTDLGESHLFADIPETMSPLRRRLELAQLIDRLLTAQPDLAAKTALFDLADSLAALLDEMQGEGVEVENIRKLDVTDMSGHWERAKTFIGIVEHYLESTPDHVDPQARQRQVVARLIDAWRDKPPTHPILLAGSTGSRGTTLMLMQAVARLPLGAIVLPGFDFEQPASVWHDLSDALMAEDHPQFRFSRVIEGLA
ncbi:MAG: double-strand break repair protein AddB, partial [Arenibacterium sp.]